ncbi:MAG: adenosylcobinamide-GDP ribazoletransferase [Alphaproteobacteria bacterium]|nr:adenosylcobinamide-GDP ribazoletransferase [Alphaproteobacteria bacterium]
MSLLTRIDPSWLGLSHDHEQSLSADDRARSCWAFPIIGMLVGAITALVWYVAHLLHMPTVICAALAVLAGVLVTGGLHEDGLADAADGLFGPIQRTVEQRLAIMRDPHLGSFAVVTLFFSLSLRVASLSSQNLISGAVMLIIAHIVSRGLMARFLTQPLARLDGIASYFIASHNSTKFFAEQLAELRPKLFATDPKTALYNSVTSLNFCVTMAGLIADIAILILWYFDFVSVLQIFALYVILIILLGGFGFLARFRLGGMTGDIYGAAQQIAECIIMVFLTVPLSLWTDWTW